MIVTDAGRDAVDAAAFCARRDCRAGWRKACERSTASGRTMLLRTAKSCGPDAPTLASSSRSRVGPTGLRQDISADDGGKQARSPRRARRKPLKPLRAGMPGDSGVLVVTRVRSTNTKCTRGRGCSGHPAFPTPSLGGSFINASGAWRGEMANVCLVVRVFSRHCERSEAIHSSLRGKMDCFAALAMTGEVVLTPPVTLLPSLRGAQR